MTPRIAFATALGALFVLLAVFGASTITPTTRSAHAVDIECGDNRGTLQPADVGLYADPYEGSPNDSFTVYINGLAYSPSPQEVQIIWDSDYPPTMSQGTVVGTGTIPSEEDGVIDAQVPSDATAGEHHLVACWLNSPQETWYYQDFYYYVDPDIFCGFSAPAYYDDSAEAYLDPDEGYPDDSFTAYVSNISDHIHYGEVLWDANPEGDPPTFGEKIGDGVIDNSGGQVDATVPTDPGDPNPGLHYVTLCWSDVELYHYVLLPFTVLGASTSPSASPTASPTPTPTPTVTPTTTPSLTPSPSPTTPGSASPSPSPSPTPTHMTPSPTTSPSATASPSPSPSPTQARTTTPAVTPTPTPSPSPTPVVTINHPTPTATPSPSPTPSPPLVIGNPDTATPIVTAAPTPTSPPTQAPTVPPPTALPATATPTPTPTPVAISVASTPRVTVPAPTRARASATPTATPVRSSTPTPSPSPTSTVLSASFAPHETTDPGSIITGGGTNNGRPEFAQSVLTPGGLSGNLGVIGTNLLLMAGTLMIIILSCELFNKTVEENHDTLKRWTKPVSGPIEGLFIRIGDAWKSATGASPIGKIGPILAVLGISGLIYGVLEPGFGFNDKSLIMFLGLIITIAIVTYFYNGGQLIMASIFNLESAILLFPIGVLVAAICVLFTRIDGFQPGVIYGFVASAAVIGSGEVNTDEDGQIIFYPAIALLGLCLVAWILISPFRDFATDHTSLWAALPETIAVGVFVGALEGTFFQMIPIRYLDGHKVWSWNKAAWVLTAGIAAFMFWAILLHDQSSSASSVTHGTPAVAIVAMAVCLVLSVGFYAFFRLRGPDSALEAEAA